MATNVVLRGANSRLEGWTTTTRETNVGFPHGTIASDVCVVVASKRRDAGSIDITDPRLTLIHASENGSVYAGTLTNLDGITVSFAGFPLNSQNYSNIAIGTWGNAKLRLTGMLTDHTTAVPAVVPGHSITNSDRLILAMTAAPFVGSGGAGGVFDWNAPDSFTSLTAGGAGTSQFSGVYSTWSGIASTSATTTTADTTSWGGADPTNHFGVSSVIFALDRIPTAAPACRKFPRSDGLGVGSGRHFPPPKSQQRSGRRFGYY